MAGTAFSATVDAWARMSQARLLAIFRASTQRVVSKAQGRIPVDTGFARASVRGSLQSMPKIQAGFTGDGQSIPYDPGNILLIIAGATLKDVVYIGWTANYVGYLEEGSSQQAPSGFVRISAMEWPRIVSQITMEAKQRVSRGT